MSKPGTARDHLQGGRRNRTRNLARATDNPESRAEQLRLADGLRRRRRHHPWPAAWPRLPVAQMQGPALRAALSPQTVRSPSMSGHRSPTPCGSKPQVGSWVHPSPTPTNGAARVREVLACADQRVNRRHRRARAGPASRQLLAQEAMAHACPGSGLSPVVQNAARAAAEGADPAWSLASQR